MVLQSVTLWGREGMPMEAKNLALALELDCRGMNCPLPVLKTKKAIVGLNPGDFLRVTATDAGSVADMAAFSRRTGNDLVDQGQADGVFFFVFRKA